MADTLSTSLADIHADQTERLILDAAVQVLERNCVSGLTIRAVAKQAGISERTIFRYFPTRDDFLNAIVAEIVRTVAIPAPPESLDELLHFPRVLYGKFETRRELIQASLHSDLFVRILGTESKRRWLAIRKILDRAAPKSPDRSRKIAAANIRYFLSATTWNYYRSVLALTLEDTIACAQTAIREAISGLVSDVSPRRRP